MKIDDIPLDSASPVGCGVATGLGAAVHRAEAGRDDTVVVDGTAGGRSSAGQDYALGGFP